MEKVFNNGRIKLTVFKKWILIGICNDSSVWVTKSHYPERLGYQKMSTSIVICVIRNPYDCIASYFHMSMTNTHNKSLSSDSMKMLLNIWDDFLKNEVKVWNNFHCYWLKKRNKVPVYFVRYEDIVSNQLVSHFASPWASEILYIVCNE